MLTLPIKRKWLDMIASGAKKEEYRELTSYYDTRFSNVGKFMDDGKEYFRLHITWANREAWRETP